MSENNNNTDTVLAQVKLALQVSYSDFDSELTRLINAAMADLNLAGIIGENAVTSNPLMLEAVITYCAMKFGDAENYDRLKASYDEQKAQLWSASGYTVWGDAS